MTRAEQLRRLVRMIYYWFLCTAFNSGGGAQWSTFKQRVAGIMPGNRNTAACIAIYGKIARVGFRSWLHRQAALHQLESLVFYRAPHVLGAVLVGSQEDLETVVREAWHGPAGARVYQVREKWYNRHQSCDLEETDAEPLRFQETINFLKEALAYLRPVMKKPNRFPVKGKYNNAVELARAAEERDLFIARLGNVNYMVSPQKAMGLQQSQSSRVSSLVRAVTDHKHLAKQYLAARGLPVPQGRLFTDFDRAADYLARCGHPVVVKPLRGSYGLGVTVDVRTAGELRAAFGYARRYHEQVILEEFFRGLDIRVLVIGGKARAALLRIPAHVVGDGRSSIDRLILRKNRLRFENPRLSKAPIIPDINIERLLARQGYTRSSVPQKDEVIFLHLKANIGAGADSVVLTGIHPDLMRLAEEAAAAFGVVDFWGVDLLVERLDRPRNEQRCAIIEINSRANIFNVQFPLYGEPFDAARSLIDSLFPEESSDSAYPFESLEIEITGQLSPGFFRRTGELARKLSLRGYIRPAGTAARAVVYGRKHRVLSFLDRLWGWRESDWLVDGIELSAYRGPAEKLEPFLVKPERGIFVKETRSNSGPSRPPEEGYGQTYIFAPRREELDVDINCALFIKEFKRRGYSAEALGEGLLKVKKDSWLGITNIYFSSLFCDKACENIHPAKKILALEGFPVLRGLRFRVSEMPQALAYFERLGPPCILTVIHPRRNSSLLVDSRKRLITAWRKAVDQGARYFIIEEHLPGRNICVAVVAGQFAGAQMLLPASLSGDGEQTLARLIEIKNEARLLNPWYRDKLLPDAGHFEELFKAAGYRPDDILPQGERLSLESEALLELGGEAVGLKNYLHRDFEDRAVEAVRAIPGLELAFVHLVIPRPAEAAANQRWAVKRIETRPAPASFHFPWKGEPHNLVEKIVDRLCLSGRTLWMKLCHNGAEN